MTADHLVELAVRDLGIIREVHLVFGPGMTALTGETGAGKTLLVGAIDLLLGGRADPSLVRKGAAEAVIEGHFVVDGEDLILSRVIPADGRSRAYIDGRMATASAVGEAAAALIDLHGQHSHRSLTATSVQRAALDRFGSVHVEALDAARETRREAERALAELGGDAGARAREADLLRFQVTELDAADLQDPDEDAVLDELEDALAGATAHREHAASTARLLAEDDGTSDLLGQAIAALDGRGPFAKLVDRLRATQAEVLDIAAEVRTVGEEIEDDAERLAATRERRQLLVELRRKYATAPRADAPTGGSGQLADVIAYRDEIQERLDLLESHDRRAAALDRALHDALATEAEAAATVGTQRRAAARGFGKAVEEHLRELAMGSAEFTVEVGSIDPGDDVTFLLAANPGASRGPLAKVASGGELARTMLALRLVLSVAPPVLVFDEVDAGIGGEAALAVGRSLASLGADHQVLVVTHLPQVAAYADAQVTVRKEVQGGTTVGTAQVVAQPERIVEVSRMLAGTPESERFQDAARELLDLAASERNR